MRLKPRSAGLLLFGVVFLFLVPWIFQGLDAVDSGGHLTNQALVWAGDPLVSSDQPSFRDLYLLTDIVGGAWLSLAPGPSLVWARLGGVLVLSLVAVVSYATLVVFFDATRVFLVVLAATAVVTMRSPRFLIEYYTFPSLLVAVALLLLAILLNATRDRVHRGVAFMLGFMVVPIILSRFLLVALIVIPPLVALYHVTVGVPGGRMKRAVPWLLAGLAVSTLVFATLYDVLGFLEPSFSSARAQFLGAVVGDDAVPVHHSPAVVLAAQAREYLRVAKVSIAVVAILWLAAVIGQRVGAWAAVITLASTTVTVSVAQILLNGTNHYAFAFIDLAIGCVIVIASAFLIVDRGQTPSLAVLTIASTAVMILNPLGSAIGIYKSIYGMWLALPLAALLTYELRDRVQTRSVRAMLSLNTPALVLAGLIGVLLQFSNLFREEAGRSQLVASFSFPGLRHIYSTPHRVELFDAALFEIERRAPAHEQILVVGEAPIVYYLTRTRPFFREPWIELESLPAITRMVDEAAKEGRFPELLVLNESTHTSGAWLDRKSKVAFLLDEYVGRRGYDLVWKHGEYTLYAPPSPPRDG